MNKSRFLGKLNSGRSFQFLHVLYVQGLEGVLKRLGERLQNQLPQTTAPVAVPSVVGQYLPLCACDTTLHTQDNNDDDNNYMTDRCNGLKSSYDEEDFNSYQKWDDSNKLGMNGLNFPTGIDTRCTCAQAKGLTRGSSVWAAATVMSSQQGRCIPRLSYVVVDGILYNANTHVSASYCFCKNLNFVKGVYVCACVCFLHLKNPNLLWNPCIVEKL